MTIYEIVIFKDPQNIKFISKKTTDFSSCSCLNMLYRFHKESVVCFCHFNYYFLLFLSLFFLFFFFFFFYSLYHSLLSTLFAFFKAKSSRGKAHAWGNKRKYSELSSFSKICDWNHVNHDLAFTLVLPNTFIRCHPDEIFVIFSRKRNKILLYSIDFLI